MLGQRELDVDDYIAMLRRRWWVIAIAAVLGPLIVYGVSLKMPNRYTSKALVLAEQPRISDTYVRPVVTDGLVERLTVMQEQILSRSRLEPLIKQFGLYKEYVGRDPEEALVNRMRADISVVPVQSVAQSREGDLPGFYINFTADNPRLAQQVCSEITTMFIAEDLRFREGTALGTTSFLESQLVDAKRKLDEQDARLAAFKRKNMGDLPDETETNLNLLNSLNTQLEIVTQALNRQQQDLSYTESMLAQQLAAWRRLKDSNTPHPQTYAQELSSMESQLLVLESRYTSDHPDIIKLKAEIKQLKEKAHEETNDKEKVEDTMQKPSSAEPPEIQQLRNQLRGYDLAIQDHTRNQQRLQQQIQLYQSRLNLSPVIEQEYKQITRDHDTALEFYNDLLKKKNQSVMTTDLERQQQGEQFRVLDPASLPEKPTTPDRPVLAAEGLAGGFAIGLLVALGLEMLDKALRTERDVEFYLGVPTLALLPRIRDMKSKKQRRAGSKVEELRPRPLTGA
jgi:polysaccharide chain length determinant protein (PEP-CTERM system associated)